MIFKFNFWSKKKNILLPIYLSTASIYACFVIFFCGPTDINNYPPQKKSEYKLPWESGLSRFVAQGNRSFVSHRDLHNYAWDFVMPNGSKVLASRSGLVVEVEDRYSGIGFKSNYILVKHKDGQSSGYAHIRNKSAVVAVGDKVDQGDVIAFSGMVGQTVFPHLHFYVLNQAKTASIPVSFNEVESGVPLAGKFYTSRNKDSEK